MYLFVTRAAAPGNLIPDRWETNLYGFMASGVCGIWGPQPHMCDMATRHATRAAGRVRCGLCAREMREAASVRVTRF